MVTSRRTVVWLLMLILMVPGLAFAQRKATLMGKVVDPLGAPVAGAVVTTTSPQSPSFKEVRTTDKDGAFIVDFAEINVTYRYRFEKVGYQTLDAQEEWRSEGTVHNEWTMNPTMPLAAGGLVAASASEAATLAYNAGVAAFKAKDYTTAETKFTEAVGHDPNLVRAWVVLSSVQILTGHSQGAAESAERAMALGFKDEVVLQLRWQAYRNLKNEVKAAESQRDLEAFGVRAEHAKTLHNEGVALVKAGDHAGAFAKFQEAANIDPNLQVTLLGLAAAALKIGRNEDAAAAADAVLRVDPQNRAAMRIRYNACLLLGDNDRLMDALVGLASTEPAVAVNGLLKLAFEAYDAKDSMRAKLGFTKVLQVNPNHPQAHYYLALLCINEGATTGAKSHLERFLALAPDGPEAANARELLKKLGSIKNK
jgi:Tfp pilus assembly protein PilF